MAEMKFNCPKCAQLIACDELWGGHQIQCPTCQAEIAVPAKAEAAAPGAGGGGTLVPEVPKHSAPRLSIGQARHQPSTVPPQMSPNSTLARTAAGFVPEKQKGGAMRVVVFILVFAVCAVGGYFGFLKVKEMQDKKNEKDKAAAANSDGGEFGHAKALYDVLDATEPGGRMMGGGGSSSPRRRAGPPAGLPVNPNSPGGTPAQPTALIAPVYTLETNAIKIPESKVNGMISGTNFVADSSRLDPVSGTLVLRFLQGVVTSPERAIVIYLRLKPGEKLAGHTWSVAPDTKGGPQIVKLWKPDPRLQPKSQNFAGGYALNLELDKIAAGQLSGKIFLSLPDPEKSVIAGVFAAETKLPDTPADSAAPAKAAAAAAAAQPGPPAKP